MVERAGEGEPMVKMPVQIPDKSICYPNNRSKRKKTKDKSNGKKERKSAPGRRRNPSIVPQKKCQGLIPKAA